jgi:imidazolonepropionase
MFFVNQVTFVAETEQIMEAGKFGLKNKIHVNQFNSIGVQSGCKYNALSVDHLEVMTTEDIEVLKNTNNACCLAVLFLFLSIPYTPARK